MTGARPLTQASGETSSGHIPREESGLAAREHGERSELPSDRLSVSANPHSAGQYHVRSSDVPFSPERYRRKYGNNIDNDLIRSEKMRDERLEDCGSALRDALLDDPRNTSVALVFGGPASGKGALMQAEARLRNHRADEHCITDDNASCRWKEDEIDKALNLGKHVDMYYVLCSLSAAMERESSRPVAKDTPSMFLRKHVSMPSSYLRRYDAYQDHGNVTFTAIHNPISREEDAGRTHVSTRLLEYSTGEEAYQAVLEQYLENKDLVNAALRER